jgi:uncharacterized membrane protein YvbJ
MKCPYCGNELDGKNICGKCGKKVTIPEHELEVEYKEFKVSEFLEIRKKQKRSEETGSGEPSEGDTRKQKGSDETLSTRPSLYKKDAVTTKGTRSVKKVRKKKRLNIVILIFIIAYIIVGAFFILNFLLR